MSAKAATLEAQVKTLEASGQPVVDVWSPRSTQFRVLGGSKLTLTNLTDVKVEIRRDDTPIGDLGGLDLMTITLDPTVPQVVSLTPKTGGEAEGFLVLHDSRFDWQITPAEPEHQTAFAGPTTLALVNHPKSRFTVELIADGGVKARVKRGEAGAVDLDAEQARSIVLRRLGNATGDATARGTICVSDGGR
ncbi:MAG TPA: hypothetical protein VMW27_12665 [Thermoanaerobaculia bacterium]|nr:hypothetical protein [Thermoanaerobaculia bacterium]